jgi:predicted amidophosphoribosyltransferase
MSLTKCPSCQADVSTKAAACPKCGHQFKYAGRVNLKDPIHIVGVIICVVILAFVIIGLTNALIIHFR